MLKEIKISKNFDLTFFNTFRLSAKAQFFVIVKNEDELLAAARWAKAKGLPLAVIGGGSNILLAGKLVKGLVIKISGEKYSVNGNYLSAWAGTSLAKLVKAAESASLSGLEWAVGVPGHLGGAVRGNAGAYGSDIGGQAAAVKVYDLNRGAFFKLKKSRCGFGYRDSVFKQDNSLLIVEADLMMKPGNKAEIRRLTRKNMRHRLQIQPKQPSAGCVFKNLEYDKLLSLNKNLALELRTKGLVRAGKIGVGYLINQLGLKGLSRGHAKISETHANFIVNTGQASSADVDRLIKFVKNRVKIKYKINLEEEIQHFGK
ncbi:MAG: UDP-N-acetylmuramate dehydrogenase [bacterium]|nr:UDP-N-acetylmuramate dehydrogenase [bacterium]